MEYIAGQNSKKTFTQKYGATIPLTYTNQLCIVMESCKKYSYIF